MRFDAARGPVRVLAGVLIVIIGYSIYKSPELNWESFAGAVVEIARLATGLVHLMAYNVNRFARDPLAAIGFILLVVGLWLIVEGFKNLVFRPKKKPWYA